jgi:hypothetical protein
LIFPEGGDAIDFESGAEAEAGFVEGDARETLGTREKPLGVAQGKPLGDGLQRVGGDDGGAIRDGVVGETVFGVADDDLLIEEDAEPFGSVFVRAGEGKGAHGDFAAIAGDGESDFTQVGGVVGADKVDCGSALAVDPFAVDGVEGPGAVEGESAGGADAGFGDGDGIERFDGVEADVDEVRRDLRERHEKSLAEEGSKEVKRQRSAGNHKPGAQPGIIPQNSRDGSAVAVPLEKEGRSAILSLSSAAAPLGARFIAERSYRGGISDVYPPPGQIEFEGTTLAAALTLAEPGALRLPGLQKGSKKREKEPLRFVHLLGLKGWG